MDFLVLIMMIWISCAANQTIQLHYDDGDVYYYQTINHSSSCWFSFQEKDVSTRYEHDTMPPTHPTQ